MATATFQTRLAASSTRSSRRSRSGASSTCSGRWLSAEADAAAEQRRVVETELAARIKVVFANAYATSEAIRINEELLGTVEAIARVAQSRYAQAPAVSRTRSRPRSSAAGCRPTSPASTATAGPGRRS